MNSPAESVPGAYQEFAKTNQALVEDFIRQLPSSGRLEFTELMRTLAFGSDAQREKLRSLQERLYREHLALWGSLLGGGNDVMRNAAAAGDHRFGAPEWSELPFFRYLRQAYLLNARFLDELGELAELDGRAKRRLQFVLRQFADAIAPTNFAATNPEVIRLAHESRGESLSQGMKLLAADLARGRISMTDERAFEVGRNLAVTPGAVVLENEVMQLIQYAPSTDQVFERPLLIVPPFINKYYILDLQPENSFVRYCVEQGFTTFIVSWRNVPPELGHLTWDNYVREGVLAPLDAVRAIIGADQVNTLGFCVGGTLLATALAVMAQKNEASVASLTLLASMLDFSETGDISVFVDREFVERAEQEFRNSGSMPGSQLAATFATLRANDLVWHFVINNYLKGREPKPFDLLYWNADGANLPGHLYTYYLRNMYLENNLRIPGRLDSCGVPVDLGKIEVPAFVLATREDHIVPWKTAHLSATLLGGRTEFVLGASGHVAGIVNPAAKKRRHYWTNSAAVPNADAWFAGAAQQAGSWWPHWANWLREKCGNKRPAPTALGNKRFSVIEPAPGRYVKKKFR
ncbi:MAG TPA: class I poly(R)-hydroxyalkanoic acid synthase [Burkholderiales bacterium]|jgi:polyhydroxyalkanoate synthase|nr:class I poly(R)-hydroxyalkanoic acid synthase [Burkholderiales bacterium]